MTKALELRDLKLIGKGMFTKCYQLSSNRVLLKSTDPIKEALWFGEVDNFRFPTLERRFDLESDVHDYRVYEMEYFPKMSSLKNNLDPSEWELYKLLHELDFAQAGFQPSQRHLKMEHTDNLQMLIEESYLPTDIKELLLEVINVIQNYTDAIAFEISPRNVAIYNGKLILLDVFFDIHTLHRKRSL